MATHYGEMRGFYAADRVASYFQDVDPAFLDWRNVERRPERDAHRRFRTRR